MESKKRGAVCRIPKVAGGVRNMENDAKWQFILEIKKGRRAANKDRAGTRIEGYGKQEVLNPCLPPPY